MPTTRSRSKTTKRDEGRPKNDDWMAPHTIAQRGSKKDLAPLMNESTRGDIDLDGRQEGHRVVATLRKHLRRRATERRGRRRRGRGTAQPARGSRRSHGRAATPRRRRREVSHGGWKGDRCAAGGGRATFEVNGGTVASATHEGEKAGNGHVGEGESGGAVGARKARQPCRSVRSKAPDGDAKARAKPQWS